MAQLLDSLRHKFFDANGDPLAGGKVFSYEAGTSTPLNTFTDASGGTANTNPIILDSNGEADIWVDNSVYKFVIKDADDNTLKTIDNVSDIATSSVTTAKLADLSVSTVKLVDSSVTTSKVNDLAITTGKLASESVTTAKIANSNVTTVKIEDGAVTRAKMEAVGQQLSVDTTGLGTTPGLGQRDSGFEVTITTTGRPVFIGLQSSSSVNAAALQALQASGTLDINGYVFIYRDGSPLSKVRLRCSFAVSTSSVNILLLPPGCIWHIDTPPAGTYEYSLGIDVDSPGQSFGPSTDLQLVAYEL